VACHELGENLIGVVRRSRRHASSRPLEINSKDSRHVLEAFSKAALSSHPASWPVHWDQQGSPCIRKVAYRLGLSSSEVRTALDRKNQACNVCRPLRTRAFPHPNNRHLTNTRQCRLPPYLRFPDLPVGGISGTDTPTRVCCKWLSWRQLSRFPASTDGQHGSPNNPTRPKDPPRKKVPTSVGATDKLGSRRAKTSFGLLRTR